MKTMKTLSTKFWKKLKSKINVYIDVTEITCAHEKGKIDGAKSNFRTFLTRMRFFSKMACKILRFGTF